MSIESMSPDFVYNCSGAAQPLTSVSNFAHDLPSPSFIDASSDFRLDADSYWPDTDYGADSIVTVEDFDLSAAFVDLPIHAQCPITAPQPLALPVGFQPSQIMLVEADTSDDGKPRTHPHNLPRERDGTSNTTRIRTNHACEACRRRKAKCSGTEPCDRCSARDITCVYSIERKMRGPNKLKPALNVRTGPGRRRVNSRKPEDLPSPRSSASLTMSSPSTPSSSTSSLPNTPQSGIFTASARRRQRAATISAPYPPPLPATHVPVLDICALEMPSMPITPMGFADFLVDGLRFDLADGLGSSRACTPAHPLQATPPLDLPALNSGLSPVTPPAHTSTRQGRSLSVSIVDFNTLSINDGGTGSSS